MREELGRNEAHGLGRLGQVDRKEVGLANQILDGAHERHAELTRPVGAHVRVERHQLHPERERALRDEHAHAAEADDAERLAVQFDALPPGAIPRARLEVGVGLGDVPGLREQQRHGVLSGREHVRLRCVHHHDAAPRGGLHIDVVETNPGPADDHQVGPHGEHGLVDLRGAADHQGVGANDGFKQLLGREPDALVDIETGRSHRIEPTGRERLGYKHSGSVAHSVTVPADPDDFRVGFRRVGFRRVGFRRV